MPTAISALTDGSPALATDDLPAARTDGVLTVKLTAQSALDRASTLAILDELNAIRAFVSLPARTPEEIAQAVSAKITPDEVTPPARPSLMTRVLNFFR